VLDIIAKFDAKSSQVFTCCGRLLWDSMSCRRVFYHLLRAHLARRRSRLALVAFYGSMPISFVVSTVHPFTSVLSLLNTVCFVVASNRLPHRVPVMDTEGCWLRQHYFCCLMIAVEIWTCDTCCHPILDWEHFELKLISTRRANLDHPCRNAEAFLNRLPNCQVKGVERKGDV